jgi:thiosulfate/3-mercaptopyruvate sulfurtransferase
VDESVTKEQTRSAVSSTNTAGLIRSTVVNELSLPGPIVSAHWLSTRLDHPDLVVADVRWYVDGRSGEAAYDAGHIEGAVFVDLDRDLAAEPGTGPGRHPLPSPEHFAAAMQRLGIGDSTTVVAYDDAGGSIAARLWWMLQGTGRQVAVLDGGISAWTGSLSNELPSWKDDTQFTVRPWPAEEVVDVIHVDALRRSGHDIILDARSAERFRGEPNVIDRRFGHIPGSRNAPWTENIEPSTGRFRSSGDLRARFRALGVTSESPAVCLCGSGVTACHNLLAMRLAQLPKGRLYPGSWSDWSADDSRPIEIN